MNKAFVVLLAVLVLTGGTSFCEERPAPDFAISVKTTEPCQVAYQKYTGPYSGIPKAIGDVAAWAATQGFIMPGLIMGEYYNSPMEVDSTKLEWAIMYPVFEPLGGFPKEIPGPGSIRKLEPTLIVYTYFQGPYENVGAAYMRLFTWVFQNGYQPASAMREIYWSDPAKTQNSKPLTEIQLPVMKAAQN